jgi:hypothetical protein
MSGRLLRGRDRLHISVVTCSAPQRLDSDQKQVTLFRQGRHDGHIANSILKSVVLEVLTGAKTAAEVCREYHRNRSVLE